MGQVNRAPYPDPQTAHDVFANHLALFVGPREVHAELNAAAFTLWDARPAGSTPRLPTARPVPDGLDEYAKDMREEVAIVFDDGFSVAAAHVAHRLAAHGVHAKVMVGGVDAWVRAGLPTET